MLSLKLSSYRRIRTVEFVSAQSQATAVGALFATDLAARGMDFEPSLAWRQMVVSDKNAPNHRAADVLGCGCHAEIWGCPLSTQ